jgi:hypothetical protein
MNESSNMIIGDPKEWQVEPLEDGSYSLAKYIGVETSATLPNLVEGKSITSTAPYFNSGSLKDIIVPEGYIAIRSRPDGNYPQKDINLIFDGNYKLPPASFELVRSIQLPASLRTLENNAFRSARFIEHITFKEGLESIGDYAFHNCVELKEVRLPPTVKILGKGAFAECRNLVLAEMDCQVTVMPYCSFFHCMSLRKVIFPKTLKKIEKFAFELCVQLKTADLPDGLEVLEWGAFKGCNKWVLPTFPNSVRIFEDGAIDFARIKKLHISEYIEGISPYNFHSGVVEEVFVDPNNKRYEIVNGAVVDKLEKQYLLIPSKPGETIFEVEAGVDVEKGAFGDRKDLSVIKGSVYLFHIGHQPAELTIPSHIKSIGPKAFNYPVSHLIQKVILPEGLEEICDSAFWFCINMEQIDLPPNLLLIGNSAFNACQNLKEITIPSSVIEVGAEAFSGCKSLSKVTMMEGMEKIRFDYDECPIQNWYLPASLKNFDFLKNGRKNQVVHAPAGSAAIAFARSNNIKFKEEG